MRKILFISFLLFFSSSCLAVIIEGNFKGEVITVQDHWNPFWDKNILGEPITGSFSYDTEKAAVVPSLGVGLVYGGIEWIDFTFNIAGRELGIAEIYPEGYTPKEYHWLEITNYTGTGGSNPSLESYSLYSRALVGESVIAPTAYKRGASFHIHVLDDSFLNGESLLQQFNWNVATDPYFISHATFSVSSHLNGEMLLNSFVRMRISELQVTTKPAANVSEPSGLGLSALILTMFLLRRRICNKTR